MNGPRERAVTCDNYLRCTCASRVARIISFSDAIAQATFRVAEGRSISGAAAVALSALAFSASITSRSAAGTKRYGRQAFQAHTAQYRTLDEPSIRVKTLTLPAATL